MLPHPDSSPRVSLDAEPPRAAIPPALPLGDSGLQLFPYAVCRVASRPFEELDALRSPKTVVALKRADARAAEAQRQRSALLEALHRRIGQLASRPEEAARVARRALLAALRNLRRRGKLSSGQERDVRIHGHAEGSPRPHGAESSTPARALGRWKRALERAEASRQDSERIYERELEAAGMRLLAMARNPELELALSTASGETLRGLLRLGRREGPAQLPWSSERSGRLLVRSLLRYASRAATKTTPFGGFTSLVAARWLPGSPDVGVGGGEVDGAQVDDGAVAEPRPLFRLPEGAPFSTAHLNKAVYSLILRRLARHPGDLDGFDLILDPSLRRTAEGYELLLSRDGEERLTCLPTSPALDRTIELLRSRGRACVPDLARCLAPAFGARPEQLAARVERMVEAGLLQICTGVPEAEADWAPGLLRCLARSRSQAARRMAALLRDLEELRIAFPELDAEARLHALDRSRSRLRRELGTTNESGAAGGSAARKPSASEACGLEASLLESVERNPLYVDRFLPGFATADAARLRPALESLSLWVDRTARHALLGCHRANLEAFYRRTFPGRESVPFLELYRGFFAEVFEPILRFERDPRPGDFHRRLDPYGLGVLEGSRATGESLRELVRRRWRRNPAAESLHLGPENLEVPGDPENLGGSMSASVFVQLLPDWPGPGRDGLLVDQQAVQVGMGKFFSRFLGGLDPALTEALRALARRTDGALVAELCDDGEASFNANLHPPLTAWEINVPSAFTGLDPATQLPLGSLRVRPAAGGTGLELVHRESGQRVVPVDLGFANPLRRPPLFRVLSLFSPTAFHRIPMPWQPGAGSDGKAGTDRADRARAGREANPGAENEDVVYRPRVVFGDGLVLARRAWRVSCDAVARQAESASPARTFGALRRWREHHGVPEEVFFHFPSSTERTGRRKGSGPSGHGTEGPGRAQTQRRRYKPQYLSFESPALCELLVEQVGRGGGHLVLEEVLPGPGQLAERAGRGHATELIVQLDRRPA